MEQHVAVIRDCRHEQPPRTIDAVADEEVREPHIGQK
jgi:hypothetical protein